MAAPRILLSYFVVILVAGLVKLHVEFAEVSAGYKLGVRWNTEVHELIVAMTAMLYIWAKWRQHVPPRVASPLVNEPISPPAGTAAT